MVLTYKRQLPASRERVLAPPVTVATLGTSAAWCDVWSMFTDLDPASCR